MKHLGKEWVEKDRPSNSLAPAGMRFRNKKFHEKDLPSEEQRETFLGMIGNLSEDEKRSLITEVLTPIGHNLMVTPKEVDGFMIDMANVIVKGVNEALNENDDVDNLSSYT